MQVGPFRPARIVPANGMLCSECLKLFPVYALIGEALPGEEGPFGVRVCIGCLRRTLYAFDESLKRPDDVTFEGPDGSGNAIGGGDGAHRRADSPALHAAEVDAMLDPLG